MINQIKPLCVQPRTAVNRKQLCQLAQDTIPYWGQDSDTMREIFNGEKGLEYLHKSTTLIRDLADDVAKHHPKQARDARLLKTVAQNALDVDKKQMNRSQQLGLYIATLATIGACGAGVNAQTVGAAFHTSNRKVSDVGSYGNTNLIDWTETETQSNETLFANAELVNRHIEDETAQTILETGQSHKTTFIALGKISGFYDDAEPRKRELDASTLADIADIWSINGLNWSISDSYIDKQCQQMEQTLYMIDDLAAKKMEDSPREDKSLSAMRSIGYRALSAAREQTPAEKLGTFQGALAVMSAVQGDLTPGTIAAALEKLDEAQHSINPYKSTGVKNRAMKESGIDSINILRRAMKNH